MKDKLVLIPERRFQSSGPLVELKIKQKGGNIKITWRCLSAIIGAEMAVRHRDSILEEENLRFEESVVEGTCEEIK